MATTYQFFSGISYDSWTLHLHAIGYQEDTAIRRAQRHSRSTVVSVDGDRLARLTAPLLRSASIEIFLDERGFLGSQLRSGSRSCCRMETCYCFRVFSDYLLICYFHQRSDRELRHRRELEAKIFSLKNRASSSRLVSSTNAYNCEGSPAVLRRQCF